MPYKLPQEVISVANAGGTINVDVTSYVNTYVVVPTTTGILTGSTTVAPTGTDTPGTEYNFYIDGGITIGAFTLTIFGYTLTAVQADKGGWLYVYYNGTTYEVQFYVDISELAVVESDRLVGNIPLSKLAIDARLTTNTTNIASTGGTTNFPVSSAARYQIITGTGALTGSVTIATTGTPTDGYTFLVDYRATFTVGAFGVSILGVVLNSSAALSGGVLVQGVYDATAAAYRVRVFMDSQASAVIVSSNIASIDGNIIQAGTIPQTALAPGNTYKLYKENPVSNSSHTVTGNNAFAIGEGCTVAGNNALALGDSNTASGANDVVIGNGASATGGNSVSIGDANNSTGFQSLSLGGTNTSSSVQSTSIGFGNTSNGTASFAIGSDNTVSGDDAFAIGKLNEASAPNAFAFGLESIAAADSSTAIGYRPITNRFGQLSVSSGRHGAGATEFAQATIINALRTTTDATPTLLTVGSGNIDIATNSVVNFKGYLTAVQQAGSAGTAGDASTWQFDGAIKNIGGVTSLLTSGVFFDAQQSRVAKETDTATAGGAATITLGASASSINNIYHFSRVYIISGTGAGQVGQVILYVGSTKVATVSANWTTPPDNTSVYRIVTQRNYDAAALPWDVTVTANNTNDALDVTVTGQTNKTIYWHLTLVCDEIKFA